MAAPKITQTIEDGALGIVQPTGDDVHVVVGCSSAGATQTPKVARSIQGLVDAFGHGPAVESAAYAMKRSGAPVIVIRTPNTNPGTKGAITVARIGASTSVLTVNGTPFDSYDVIAEITDGGTIGQLGIRLKVSLDGGETYREGVALPGATPATYAIPDTGLTLSFAVGTLDAGDKFSLATVAPSWVDADLTTAFGKLEESTLQWGFVHVVGTADDSAFDVVKTAIEDLEAVFKYGSVILDVQDVADGDTEADWTADLQLAFSGKESTRIVVGAGHCRIESPINGRKPRRPCSWLAAARAVSVPVHEDLARIKRGPHVGAVLVDANGMPIAHDERRAPGLDDDRFLTLTTIIGRNGVFVTNPNVMAPAGSDFKFWQYRRVMDKACKLTYDALLEVLSDSPRIDSATGFILEKDARAIEAAVNAKLQANLVAEGNVTSATFVLARTDNILSTHKLTGETRIVPRGVVKEIVNTIAFSNPALAA